MEWHPTPRSDAFDAALAGLLGVLAGVSLYMGGDPAIAGPFAEYDRPLGIGLVLAIHVPLAIRRRHPLAVALIVTAAYLPLRLEDVPELQVSQFSLFIAFYTAGAYGGRRRDLARAASALGIGGLVVWTILRTPPIPYEGRVPLEVLNTFTAAANALYVATAWFLGDLIRHRRRREAELQARTGALEAAQHELASRAVVDERLRIARELHDVLAHHVSLMGVQAGAARRVLDTRPAEVPPLLGSIESSSRQAVGELQRLLGLLRHDGEATEPPPTLDRLPALAEQMRDAGLPVELHVDTGDALRAGIELTAYRIVQEALTNTLKHGGPGATARVDVRRQAKALELVVADDGAGNSTTAGSGHGIPGMEERARLHGGELRHGRRPGGGFEVRAWLPLEDAS